MPAKGRKHSEETKAKIGAAHRGRKRSPEEIEKNRLAHIGLPSSRKGAHHTEEAKAKLREARANQVHPSLVSRGITIEMAREAESNGMRWCSGECKGFVDKKLFYGDKIRQCGKCVKAKQESRRSKWTPRQRSENAKYLRKYRVNEPEVDKRDRYLKKYDVDHDWYIAKLAEQGGHCALCDAIVDGRKLAEWCNIKVRKYLLVDHDHETGLARGLLCAKCNTALHRVEYVQDWATSALAYLARYSGGVTECLPTDSSSQQPSSRQALAATSEP